MKHFSRHWYEHIWPWSTFYDLRNAKHCADTVTDYFDNQNQKLKRDVAYLTSLLQRHQQAYRLKVKECEELMNALALSPKTRKRFRVKIRRFALIWHKSYEAPVK